MQINRTCCSNDVFFVCLIGFQTCGYRGDYKLHGVLSLEHLGRPTGVYDGVCISVLLIAASKDMQEGTDYEWMPVDISLVELLKKSLNNPLQFIGL